MWIAPGVGSESGPSISLTQRASSGAKTNRPRHGKMLFPFRWGRMF
jgi:hypothetical protein